ncbi:MAG TPA: ABC transporter permease [Acidimicrobiales bacterium]|nr:ABC transporter permease [Acidimicrobiales bacterium]
MIGYIVRRLMLAIVVLLGVTVISFVLMNLVASGPQLALAIIGPKANPATIHAFILEYGLNHPLPVRYASFLWQLLHGNLGFSYRLNQSVDSIIAAELPKDVLLVGSAFVLAVFVAIPIGMTQAIRRNRAFDYTATGVSFVLYSMPSYALGLLLIAGLSVSTHILPPEAPQATTIGGIISDPAGLVLPVTTLTLINYALFSRYVRSSSLDTLANDYIRTARAKGLSTIFVVYRHVLRNSLIPVTTLIGLSFPAVITAGLVVEYLFNFPGLGLTYFNAAQNLDYPVELGITILIGVATVVGNLLADISYAILDPRVRYS